MQTTPAEPPVLRTRIHAELQQARGPLTARQLAERLLPPDLESGHRQTMRALVQLEDAGHATRHHGTGPTGGHYLWRAR
jgi:hypothetical protein